MTKSKNTTQSCEKFTAKTHFTTTFYVLQSRIDESGIQNATHQTKPQKARKQQAKRSKKSKRRNDTAIYLSIYYPSYVICHSFKNENFRRDVTIHTMGIQQNNSEMLLS
jgi:hypothetical protein